MAHPSNQRLSRIGVVRLVLFFICLVLVVCIMRLSFSGPSTSKPKNKSTSFVSCPQCYCDCPSEVVSFSMTSDIFNMSSSGCTSKDPEMNEEMKKDIITLFSEEISLKKNVTGESLEHTKALTMDTKILSSHYKHEAKKCYVRTVTCEDSRARAEAALLQERKLTTLWEERAREIGWSDGKIV